MASPCFESALIGNLDAPIPPHYSTEQANAPNHCLQLNFSASLKFTPAQKNQPYCYEGIGNLDEPRVLGFALFLGVQSNGSNSIGIGIATETNNDDKRGFDTEQAPTPEL
jgi:hypothetical protein